MHNFKYTIHSYTENAVYVSLGDGISTHYLSFIKSVMNSLTRKNIPGFIEAVPGYNNITIYYDPLIVYQNNHHTNVQQIFINELDKFLTNLKIQVDKQCSPIEIPVCYDPQLGIDLEFVAKSNHLTVDEVIQYHSERVYTVHMLGFSPGFPFLGGMNEKIATPRKKVPSRKIPAGSVGIAGKQTGIYPNETPGGWQIIGRTPAQLFNVHQKQPSLLNPGDLVKFYPISLKSFKELEEKMFDYHSS